MKKIVIIIIIITVTTYVLSSIILFDNALFTAQATTGDEVRASKKIISVVYDDSSSMYGERWSYTDYAMQALIALLNALQ